MRPSLVAVAVAVTVALLGCHANRAAYVRVSGDNHELRDAFNGDADDVRVIMLVSPS